MKVIPIEFPLLTVRLVSYSLRIARNRNMKRLARLVEWGFYALSASKAIFRARTYNCNLFSPVMMMNETRRKPTTGRQSPSLFDKWHGIFYMPSRIARVGELFGTSSLLCVDSHVKFG